MINEFPAAEIANQDIVFCFVDNTWSYTSGWTKEIIKNQSDYTITNITCKHFQVLQGLDEDILLRHAAKSYKHAVVFSTGTEFINGDGFFDEVIKECTSDYLVKGHILDRGNAYYELHHQCYLVNLENYNRAGQPAIGNQELGCVHHQVEPIRSQENFHDEYTPYYLQKGSKLKSYEHKLHGWNIVSTALEQFDIHAFNQDIKNNKKHYYPENQKEFLKHSSWLFKREQFCSTEFVHTKTTETLNTKLDDFEQILTPASNDWGVPGSSKVFMYDYNLKSIEYWQEKNPTNKFIHCNLLHDLIDLSLLDTNKKTLINLSNIFAYEATTVTHSLEHRLFMENETIKHIQKFLPNACINFTLRACSGFSQCQYYGKADSFRPYKLNELTIPTWHANGDWQSNL